MSPDSDPEERLLRRQRRALWFNFIPLFMAIYNLVMPSEPSQGEWSAAVFTFSNGIYCGIVVAQSYFLPMQIQRYALRSRGLVAIVYTPGFPWPLGPAEAMTEIDRVLRELRERHERYEGDASPD